MKSLYTATLMSIVFLAISSTAYGDDDQFEFEAELSGEQEVPAVDTDTEGEVDIDFKDDLSKARFKLEVEDGRLVTQAHLHCGRAGENGPVVVFLFDFVPDGVDVDGRLARGTLRNADITEVGANCVTPTNRNFPGIGRPVNNIAALFFAMRDGLIYANVHTIASPGGEVRGQLLPDD